MPLITPSTRFKLTGLLVQDEFEIYIASLKTTRWKYQILKGLKDMYISIYNRELLKWKQIV
jgi:hypothetical protein